MSELRKRYVGKRAEVSEIAEKLVEKEEIKDYEKSDSSGKNSYWLTRIVYLRAIGTVYFVAFLVAIHQNRALIGTKGKMKICLSDNLTCFFLSQEIFHLVKV